MRNVGEYVFIQRRIKGEIIMAFSAKEMIRKRKSCRTFDGEPLKVMDRASLEKYIENVDNPFGVPVEFRLLDADKYNLMSPVIAGADVYIAAKAPKCANFEIGLGYSFEKVCLLRPSRPTIDRSCLDRR